MVVPREIKFNAYTKCLGANEVYYGRCANCEWNPVLFLRSICHCGCEREGSDIKRDGWVSCFIICHCSKKKSKWRLKRDNLISFITLATPMFEKQLKPSLMSVGLKPCLSLYVIKIHKA